MAASSASIGNNFSLRFNLNNPPTAFLLNQWPLLSSQNIQMETGNRSELIIDGKPLLTNDMEMNSYLSTNTKSQTSMVLHQELALTALMEIISELVAGEIDKKACLEKLNALCQDSSLFPGHCTAENCLNFSHFKLFELLKVHFSEKDISVHKILVGLTKLVANCTRYAQLTAKLSQLKNPTKVRIKDEAKLEELPDAEMGKVVVRFPPEASGFLHIGHAKAAFANYLYKEKYQGKLIFRFDDTNPDKENSAFEEAILSDFKTMGMTYDSFSKTSDHFDTIIDMCTQLIKSGKAFADNTDDEELKKEREQKLPSKYRTRPIEETLSIWEAMQQGDINYKDYCIRAKIDYQHENGSLRDPVIFRQKIACHPHTGTKYKVYPIYIFACTIVDSLEGVTHAMRTTEYHDKDPVTYWFLDALNLRKYHVVGYGRLSLMYTILSKRKLTWFVNEKLVDGWDDPRMPTVRGMMRRGLTTQGLRQYIESVGASVTTSMVSQDKLWAFNRSILETSAPRFMAVKSELMLTAYISGMEREDTIEIAVNPTDSSKGKRKFSVGPKMLVECPIKISDLKVGNKINLIFWMNFRLDSIDIDARTIILNPLPGDTDFKSAIKMNHVNASNFVELIQTTYGNLLTKAVLDKGDDFKDFINKDSKSSSKLFGESLVASLKKSDHLQFYRHGFYIVDRPAMSDSNSVDLVKIPE